jgi:hypothetical protein
VTVSLRRSLLLGAVAALATGAATPPHKPDAADTVAGTYAGAVISDSQGSSKDGVMLTLTRVGPNKVSIASDYPRLPVLTIDVERAMNSIVQRTGDTAFAYDIEKKRLDVSFHNEVSWSGEKQVTAMINLAERSGQ